MAVSSFGRRRDEDVVEEPVTRIPAIVLPPVRLRLELELDPERLDELFKVIQAGVYDAARRGLDEAVEDFTAEQRERDTADGSVGDYPGLDGAENSPPAAAGTTG